ncbi:MAG: glycosyltransferase [bacterium]|nr:glycosyltransferase [bacterium]
MKLGFGLISYNRKHLLERMLPFLLARDFDYGVLVDNAGTDGSREVLKVVAAGQKNIAFIGNKKNHFPGYARNQVVAHLMDKVDVIVFVDNDIIVKEKCFYSLREIFSLSQSLGQVTPLTVYSDFLLEEYNVGGHRLARTISNCSSAITAVRSTLFREGLRWRESRWKPENNNEIGEDYFLSREIKKRGYEFAWFGLSNESGCENIGRSAEELERSFDYYLETFAQRGMLSRLKSELPHRVTEIDTYAGANKVPEIHGRFSRGDKILPLSEMSAEQQDNHHRKYLSLLPVIEELDRRKNLEESEIRQLSDAAATCRDYFDNLEESHPLFSQRTLQAALFFNRICRHFADRGKHAGA